MLDYDNDGDLDLVMTNGVDFPGSDVEDFYNTDRMRLWENDGAGAMTEVSHEVGLDDTRPGKGLLVFDYDGDGDLDLFVVNNPGQSRLYRNVGGDRRSFLRVELRGVRSNAEGLGAKVTLLPGRGAPALVREIGTATHFLGQSERTAHFGLGRRHRRIPRVTIEWPSGRLQVTRNVRIDRTLVVVEGLPACGLLGVEPIFALVALQAWRRARGARKSGRDLTSDRGET